MKLSVNEKIVEVANNITVEQLLLKLGETLKGCAVAVNQDVISRSQWGEYQFSEGDKILLFQAIAGG